VRGEGVGDCNLCLVGDGVIEKDFGISVCI
jgi:hypothetical protein